MSLIIWALVLAALPLCAAWLLGMRWYWFDVLASEQLLIGWAALTLAAIVVALRRWRAAFSLLLFGCLALTPVVTRRQWVLPEVDVAHKDKGIFRVVSCNINPLNDGWQRAAQTLMDLDADIVILLELSPVMSWKIQDHGALPDERYQYRLFRGWQRERVSACAIFSRWPLERIGTDEDKVSADNALYARLDRPGGSCMVGLMHPLSPRSAKRWAIGNEVTSVQADLASDISGRTGLPVVMGVDLNAGPAQQRGRKMRSRGLRMSKPVLRVGGSFPVNSALPTWAVPQLDDVWSLGDARAIAWTMFEVSGSDHRAVVVDLRIGGE